MVGFSVLVGHCVLVGCLCWGGVCWLGVWVCLRCAGPLGVCGVFVGVFVGCLAVCVGLVLGVCGVLSACGVGVVCCLRVGYEG